MKECKDCQYRHGQISKEPCFSCVTDKNKPHFKEKPPQLITNFDYIQTLNRNQLALFLSQIADCLVCQHELNIECKEPCHEQWLKWLNQEKVE